MTLSLELGVRIERNANIGPSPFAEIFRGFERVGAVRKILGDQTDKILEELLVEVTESRGYMWINGTNGSVMVGSTYLKEGQERDIYLDVIHELVHISQRREGKDLWDKSFAYVDRPTEIEAYRVAVDEARRIGVGENELVDYLRAEFISAGDFSRLLATLGVEDRKPQT